MAIQISKLVNGEKSVFILLSRNEVALADVKNVIQSNNPQLKVESVIVDLSLPYNGTIDECVIKLESLFCRNYFYFTNNWIFRRIFI